MLVLWASKPMRSWGWWVLYEPRLLDGSGCTLRRL